MSVMHLSVIEQIAQDIEDWGDGWRFMWNPDDHGRRARLSIRPFDDKDNIRIEIAIHIDGGQYFVFIGCDVVGNDGRWTTVSASVRNPVIRKALDEINRRLDAMP